MVPVAFGVARPGRAARAPALPPRAADGAAAAAELQGLSVAGVDLAEGLKATPGPREGQGGDGRCL